VTNQEIIAAQQAKIALLRTRLQAARRELKAVAFTDGLFETVSQSACCKALHRSGGLPRKKRR